MFLTGLCLIAALAAVAFAAVRAYTLPHEHWRAFDPSLVVALLTTTLLGIAVDGRAFLLTFGLLAAFGTYRAVHRLRQPQENT